VDVVEVAPRYDPGGRTAQLAARALFELLFVHPVGAWTR
jgi:arginase family enzyme